MTNQLPMYAENAIYIVNDTNKALTHQKNPTLNGRVLRCVKSRLFRVLIWLMNTKRISFCINVIALPSHSR